MNNRRSYYVFLTIQGAQSLFFGLIFTISLVYQVQVVHLNPLQLVLVGTILEITSFIAQVPTGIFADAYSRRWSIIFGTFLVGLGFTLEGSIPLFGAVLLAQILWGLGSSFLDGALEAWIADEVGEAQVGHAFLRGAQIGQLLGLIGLIASVAIASIQLSYAIITGGLLFLGLGIYLLVAMPEHRQQVQNQAEQPSDRPSWRDIINTARTGTQLVRRNSLLLIIMGIALFFGISSEGFDRLQTAHLLINIHIPGLGPFKPVVWFSVIGGVSMVLSTAATEVIRRKVSTQNHKAVVIVQLVSNVLRAACMVLFALTGNFVVALLALWGASVARILVGPYYQAWLVQNIDSRVRATVISMNSLVDAGGQILGGPVVGWIGVSSLRTALAISGFLLMPVVPLYIWSWHKGAQAQEGAKPLLEVPS